MKMNNQEELAENDNFVGVSYKIYLNSIEK